MGKDYLQESSDLYIRAMIGEHVHVPLNMIFQGTGDPNKAAGLFQFQTDPRLIKQLTQNADLHRNHVLLIGDAFIRTKIVTQSKHLTGNGIASTYMSGFVNIEDWIEKGKLLKGDFK